MRVLLGSSIAASALAASCSLLVQFHDQGPSDCEGGACATDATMPDVGTGKDSGGPDVASVDSGGGVDAPAGDGPGSPCTGKANGYYCGDNGLDFDAGVNDLIHCVDGGIGMDTACNGGCFHVPDPFPDACNPCFGVANGKYCGRDLAGFPASNADIFIQCQGGVVSQAVACANGCGSNGTMSACL